MTVRFKILFLSGTPSRPFPLDFRPFQAGVKQPVLWLMILVWTCTSPLYSLVPSLHRLTLLISAPFTGYLSYSRAEEKGTHSWKVELICFMWDIQSNKQWWTVKGSHWGWLPCDCISHAHTCSTVADCAFKCHPLELLARPYIVPAMHFCYATQLNDDSSLAEVAELHILRIIDN